MPRDGEVLPNRSEGAIDLVQEDTTGVELSAKAGVAAYGIS